MQTAKEYREQLEWFWLFCQEEAWQEDQELAVRWQLVETTTFGTESQYGRSYSVEKVITEYAGSRAAQDKADQLNTTAKPSQYYSIRKVEN